jgi:phage shock protein A
MAMINRVARLFRADFNAVLDQIEEPEQLLRQAIRDMEDDVTLAEQDIAALEHEQKLLGRRCAELHTAIAGLDEQLDLCFESAKDDLARGLIRKKLEAESLLKHVDSSLLANREACEDQQRRVEENRRTLEALRQKADVFSRQVSPSGDYREFDDAAWQARVMTIGDDDVEIAYLREKSRREVS